MGPTFYCLVIAAAVLMCGRAEVHEPTVYLTAIGDGPGDARGQIQVSGDQINAYLKTLQNVPGSIYKGAHLITHMEEDQFGDDHYQPSSSTGDKVITATKVDPSGTYDDGYNYDDDVYEDAQPRSKYEYDYDEKESPREPAKSYRKSQKSAKESYPPIHSMLSKYTSKPSKYSGHKLGLDSPKGPIDVKVLREILDGLVKQIETNQPGRNPFGDFSVDTPPKRDFSKLPTDYLDNVPKRMFPNLPMLPYPMPMYGMPPMVPGSIPVPSESHQRKSASEKKIFMKANELLKLLTGSTGHSASASTEVESYAPPPPRRSRPQGPPPFTAQQAATIAALNTIAHFASASTPSAAKVSAPASYGSYGGYGHQPYPPMHPTGFYPGYGPFGLNPYMPFAASSYMHSLNKPCPKAAAAGGFPFGPIPYK